jgi:3-deoxy-D-manno-octulosonic-acid transferase
MTILYDSIFILFSLLYLPYLLFTGRYHKDFWQRFGFYPEDLIGRLKGRKIIWVHAVSVGEVMAGRTLCEAILERYTDKKLVISTITKTGNDVARRFFGERAVILYLPVDLSLIVNKVLDKIRPAVFMIVETEIWPNLVTALHKRGIPVMMVNGRISPKSYRHYMKIKFFLKKILERFTFFCMQNDEYAKRIKDMGAPVDKIAVTGSMKFDAAARAYAQGRLDTDAIRRDLNLEPNQPLFIAGSTHRPEEEIVLEVYKDLLKTSPALKLLIAPRHIERVSEIEAIVRRFGFDPVKVSGANRGPQTANTKVSVLILDAMGHLNQLFSIGTIVFIGGSLMRKGGQNILEPAIFSKPIIFGPHMFNFKDIANEFIKEDAACMVKDRREFLKTTSRLLGDASRRRDLGDHARALMDKNIGATERTLNRLEFPA